MHAAICTAIVAALSLHAAAGAAPGGGQPAGRTAALELWAAAVGSHVPGAASPAALEVATWPEGDLDGLAGELREVARYLVRAHTEFRRTGRHPDYSSGRRTVAYGQVRDLFRLTDEEAQRGDLSRFVLRAAVLHTDIATLVETSGTALLAGTPVHTRTTLLVADGQQLGVGTTGPHWEVARMLLDLLPAGSPLAPLTIRWYTAAAAYLHSEARMADLVPHLARARQLYPDDAGILFYSGVVNEKLAAPHIQQAIERVRPPTGVKLDVADARTHLQAARTFFRRALALEPQLVEARVRLGYVLGLLDDHQESARQLEAALGSASDRALRYYAALLLGRARTALDDLAGAREAYQGAAALYPWAQSPRIALSYIARAAGEPDGSGRALLDALGVAVEAPSRQDPWWWYYNGSAEEASRALESWRASAAPREGA